MVFESTEKFVVSYYSRIMNDAVLRNSEKIFA